MGVSDGCGAGGSEVVLGEGGWRSKVSSNVLFIDPQNYSVSSNVLFIDPQNYSPGFSSISTLFFALKAMI